MTTELIVQLWIIPLVLNVILFLLTVKFKVKWIRGWFIAVVIATCIPLFTYISVVILGIIVYVDSGLDAWINRKCIELPKWLGKPLFPGL